MRRQHRVRFRRSTAFSLCRQQEIRRHRSLPRRSSRRIELRSRSPLGASVQGMSLQSDMQEARLRVQREKTKIAGQLEDPTAATSWQRLVAAGSTGTTSAPTVIRGSVGGSFNPELESESALVGKDISAQLSASQIEMFENESSELIKSLESDLAAIKKAESRLYEISELQTQVVQQLEQQGRSRICCWTKRSVWGPRWAWK